MNRLNFRPLPGLSSSHLQTIASAFRHPGKAPPSSRWLVKLTDGDQLSCEVSTPPHWRENGKTIALLHGLGGSHASSYMIRLARKLYLSGNKVVRINLRGCGSGKGLSKLPYSAGTSNDVLAVIHSLKRQAPASPLQIIGFSLGGNIVLKLAGELGKEAGNLVKAFMAVCPPLDLAQTVRLIEKKRHSLYHYYYLKKIRQQATDWVSRDIRTLYEFDDLITAPLWGYKGADEYYKSCSSIGFLPKIEQHAHLLFAEDDPFIDVHGHTSTTLPPLVHLYSTKHGGHMGFLGSPAKTENFYWLDRLLLNWIEGDFTSDLATCALFC